MHKEILNSDQLGLLPLVAMFRREFYLVGGTAIALYLGHRRSIDFDLFKFAPLNQKSILKKLSDYKAEYLITRRVHEQMNVTIKNVKFTFFEYPFEIEANCNFEKTIKLPDLLTLAAMKAYALGRRSKWKDYVDLYYIIKDYYSITEIALKAKTIYKDMFSEKLMRAQISYFNDIDYSEPVEYLQTSVSIDEVKSFLIEKAVDIF
ncbi:MAG: nucleotidyl transferase AbiEii/AbiGii toxin family protein [Bacteroidetes bacterium]|nr:nucleotidyl transferase AbiEii/AbiGii toxin family protein [Bacteroidota bacterium]